jgi:Cu2+-exporting ATPase
VNTGCFHCGAPIPAGSTFSVAVRGGTRPVCCAGCRAVAELIEQHGLAQFYDFRTVPSTKPESANAAAFAVCDRPDVARQLVRVDGEQNEFRCRVDGMTCSACTWLIDRGLRGIDGVTDVSVNPLSAEATIRFDPRRTRVSAILAALASFGFAPRVQAHGDASGAAEAAASRAELKRLAVAGLGAMQVMTLSLVLYAGAFEQMETVYQRYFALVSMLIATPVVLYAGAPLFRSAWRDIARRRLGMDVPVALALGAALAFSIVNALRGTGHVYFDSATMFLFFLALGRFLEKRARHRAGGVFNALADLQPLAALRVRNGELEHVGSIELTVGDVVRVAPGEAVPADGELVSNDGTFDEALLSGESLGRKRYSGDALLGGSLNAGSAPVDVRVTHLGADSYLERIRSLLGRALADRPQFLHVADRFAAAFVGGLLLVTLIASAVWWQIAPERAFEIALALLVVTCPCALSLAAPTAFAVALGRLAQHGLLLRSARVLERLGDVDLWLFDKTGTLTEGRLGIAATRTFGSFDADRALRVAAALEAGIEHPVARAFRAVAPTAVASNVEYSAGYGVTGEVAGKRYRLGSARFVGATDGDRAPGVYLADDSGVVAHIELADRLRPHAREAVAALAADTRNSLLASGDTPAAVAAVAARVGIPHYYAEQTPADKLELLREAQQQGRVVAAIGDGINDAPLLARADVSIAMVAGSELARATADVVFTGDDLRTLARLPELAAATRRVVRQNLAWAALYNVVAVPLAASGFLAPWMAAIGMSASSLIVVGNALRLNGMFRKTTTAERAAPTAAPAALPEREAA